MSTVPDWAALCNRRKHFETWFSDTTFESSEAKVISPDSARCLNSANRAAAVEALPAPWWRDFSLGSVKNLNYNPNEKRPCSQGAAATSCRVASTSDFLPVGHYEEAKKARRSQALPPEPCGRPLRRACAPSRRCRRRWPKMVSLRLQQPRPAAGTKLAIGRRQCAFPRGRLRRILEHLGALGICKAVGPGEQEGAKPGCVACHHQAAPEQESLLISCQRIGSPREHILLP
mgnify:CR=1 FL=1